MRGTNFPWGMIAFLTALNLLGYLDNYILSAVGPSLQHDLHLTDAAFGVLGSAFLWGFVFASPLFGRLAKRFSRIWLLGFGVALWSLATVLFGVLGSFILLVILRVLVGVGMADFTSIAPTVIDDITNVRRKGIVFGLFFAAIPIGSALGFIFGGLMDASYGWRVAFLSAGILGLLFTPFVFYLPRREKRSSVAAGSFVKDLRILASSKRYLSAVFGFAAQTFAVGGFAYWVPTFLTRKFAVPAAEGSIVFGVIAVVTGLLGALSGGWIEDRMRGSDRVKNALVLSTIATAIATPFAFSAVFSTTPLVFFVSIAVVQLAVFATFPPINNAILGSVSAPMRAMAEGGSSFVGHFFGDMISISLIGLLSELWGGLSTAMLILPIAFVINAFLWWGGARTAMQVVKK